MTTPNQPAPDGAFVVGGGDYHYGQDYTENLIRTLFEVPTAGFNNALEFFREHLLKLPLEALQKFQGMIPGATNGDFSNVVTAVNKIMSSLTESALFLKEEVFDNFVEGAFSAIENAVEAVQTFIQSLVDAILQAIRKIPVVGGGLADIIAEIGGLQDKADTAKTTADETAAGVIEGWANGSAAGTNPDVYDTMQAIKTAISNGYTVETITSTRDWNRPDGLAELYVTAIGSGQTGQSATSPNPGIGGIGGGFTTFALDPAQVSSVVRVTVGLNGTQSSFGTYLATILGEGHMATQFGFAESTSVGGRGGTGGMGFYIVGSDVFQPTVGSPGESTPIAAGGPGATVKGATGSPGGNADLNAVTKCGGGGGGGGAGNGQAPIGGRARGGQGGPGGFPGGGGGGGGGGDGINNVDGPGGVGGGGVVFIFYK